MKKFLLGLILLFTATGPLFGQSTTGFHRTAVALARASSGVTAQIVPNAKVTVTSTATGLAATIFSDPALSSQITPSVVIADNSGNYGYYIPLGYCVTETLTSPGQGTQVITNICVNNVGSGATFQTGGVNNFSQSNLNLVSGSNVTLTNTSGGNVQISAAGGSLSPLTTKGDLWGYSITDARVPVGTNGQLLTADSSQLLGVKWATPATTGLTSLNSQTGPAITVHSSDSSVTVTTTTNDIDLTTAAAGDCSASDPACVQYAPSNTAYYVIGDSRAIHSSDDATTLSVTGITCNGTDCTATATNTLVGGTDWVLFVTSAYSPTCLGPSLVPVSSSTGSTFTFPESSTFSCSGSQTGTTNTATFATHTLVANMAIQPFIKNHGTIKLLLRSADLGGTYALWNSAYTSQIHPLRPSVTGVPTSLIVHLGYDDLSASPCVSVATLQTNAATLWSSARADGISIIETSEAPSNTNTIFCDATQTQELLQFNQWKAGQNLGSATNHWDKFADIASPLGNSSNSAMWLSDQRHYANGGNGNAAETMNTALASQGTLNLGSMPSQGPNLISGYQLFTLPTGTSNACELGIGINNGITSNLDLCADSKGGFLNSLGTEAIDMRWNSSSSTMQNVATNNGIWGWKDGAGFFGNVDTGMSRESAGVIDFGNGTKSDKSATIKAANLTLTGTCTGCISTVPLSSVTAAASPSGTFDFSGATQIKLPTTAGYASAATSEVGYDSTNNNWHIWQNGADTLLIPFATSITSGDCYFPQKTSNTWAMVDAGGPCGVSGGGSAWSSLTSGTNTTMAAVVGSGASIGVTGTGTINSTSIGGITVTGTPSVGNVPTATSSSAATWQAPVGGGNYINLGGAVTWTGCSYASGVCTVSGTSTVNVTISAVPGTYLGLRIQANVQGSSNTNNSITMRLNGDSGANYNFSLLRSDSSASFNNFNGGTAMLLGYGSGGTVPAIPLSSVYSIPFYASTTFDKNITGSGTSYNTGTSTVNVTTFSGSWLNTAAVTSITISVDASQHMLAGSQFSIYGVN